MSKFFVFIHASAFLYVKEVVDMEEDWRCRKYKFIKRKKE